MNLYCNDQLVGTLTNYQPDAPFFEADISPTDHVEFERLINANIFLNEIVPAMGCNCFTDPENDTYANELVQLCITEQDVDAVSLGRWRVENNNQSEKITLLHIRPDGRVRWRSIS